jgi:segregation and condensation protein A
MTDDARQPGVAIVQHAAQSPPAEAVAYHVTLPIFEGPLDLLLHLIEREELDITSISLAQITDQYLSYLEALRGLGQIDADGLSDFLVVAARLVLIKSRALLPRRPALPGEEEEEDPGEQLARQLREYKRFKQVAMGLQELDSQHWRSFVRVAPVPKMQSRIDLEGVTLESLLAAVREALSVTPPLPPVGDLVQRLTITIADQVHHIVRLLSAGERTTFRSLLSGAASRVEIVVTFLAVLELLKRQRIRATQDELFGEIVIEAAGGGQVPIDEPIEGDFTEEGVEWPNEETDGTS